MERLQQQNIRSRRRERTQSGYALIEILAALVVISAMMVTLFAAIFALIASSSSHRKIVLSGLEATTIAESLERAPYLPCGSVDDYKDVIDLPPPSAVSGLEVSIGSVEYLHSKDSNTAEFEERTPCAPDLGVQSIEIVVSRPPGTGTEKIAFTKRDDRCSEYERDTADSSEPVLGQSC